MYLFITLLLGGCSASGDKNDEGDEGGQDTDTEDLDVVGADYTMAKVAVPEGCEVPEARRYHSMTYFETASPVSGFDLPLERGFLLVGGVATGGGFLSDMWVFDLGNALPTTCPWIRVATEGAIGLSVNGIAGGSLTFDESSETFYYVGGHQDTGPNTEATDLVRALPLEDLPTASFSYAGSIPSWTSKHIEYSAEICSHPPDWECREIDPQSPAYCDLYETIAVDPCTGGAVEGDTWQTPVCQNALVGDLYGPWDYAFDGCFADPACAYDPADPAVTYTYADFDPTLLLHAVDSETVSGLSQFGAAFDPVAGFGASLTLVGGTTGCMGTASECTSWVPLSTADHRPPTFSLAMVNSSHVMRVGHDGAGAVEDLTASQWSIPAFTSEEDETVLWPSQASSGARFVAGVFTGRHWRYDSREWESWEDYTERVPAGDRRDGLSAEGSWFVGGTMLQDVGPRARNDPGLHSGQGIGADECFTQLFPSEPRWIENPAPTSWFSDESGDLVVDEVDAGVSSPLAQLLGNNLDVMSTVGNALLPSGVFASALTAVQDDAFLVVGGRSPTHPEGHARAWLVDVEASPPQVQYVDYEQEALIPRYGAATVFDPIERRAYVFGGHDTDASVFTIWSETDVVAPNYDSTFDITNTDLEYVYVPPAGDPGDLVNGVWDATLSFEFTHSCSGPPFAQVGSVDTASPVHCFANQIALSFGDPDADGNGLLEEKADVNLALELIVGGERFPVEQRLIAGDEGPDGSPVVALQQDSQPLETGRSLDPNGAIDTHTWRLPRALMDGEAATLVVSWTDGNGDLPGKGGVPYFGANPAAPDKGPASLHDVFAYGAQRVVYGAKGVTNDCSNHRGIVLRGMPFWMETTPDAVADLTPIHLDDVHVVPPAGFTAVGIGASVACSAAAFGGFEAIAPLGACFDAGVDIRPSVDLRLFALDSVVSVAVPAHPELSVYRDSCLDPGIVSEIDSYFGQAGFTYDKGKVAEWLGPTPVDHLSVVLVPGANSVFAGTTHTGSVLVSSFAPTGEGMADPDGENGFLSADAWQSTFVHEYSHQWFGVRRASTAEAQWLQESFPTLIETMLYPMFGENTDRLMRGHGLLVANSISGIAGQDLEVEAAHTSVAYVIGPYTLAQLVHAASARSPNLYPGALDALQAFATALFPPGGDLYETLDGGEIAGALDALQLPDFYGEWIEEARVGTPVVTTSVVIDPVTSDAVLTLDQGQTAITAMGGIAFPLFSDVPAYLGCSTLTAPAVPLPGCGLSAMGLASGSPILVNGGGGPSLDLEVDQDFATLASGQLLPGRAGDYAISDGITPVDSNSDGAYDTILAQSDPSYTNLGIPVAATWRTYCRPGSADPMCQIDLDSDGWPEDCIDNNPLVHPAILDDASSWLLNPPAAMPVDTNCDGWPSPSWAHPSVTTN